MMATHAQRDDVVTKTEEQAIVMLYLQNINQSWHGQTVRYLEDAYAAGNDIYPISLPYAYHFLDDWKAQHCVPGKFTGGMEGVTMATAMTSKRKGSIMLGSSSLERAGPVLGL